jgi:putative PIN family toxin of toxin-antitoxin system
MRIFLDTNVLASALGTRGLCEDVLLETLASHDLIISGLLLRELEQVLIKKFRVPVSIVDDAITFLRQVSIETNHQKSIKIPVHDKSDIIILSDAIEGNTDLFVTGDKELLRLKRVGRMRIVSTREFWNYLKR